MTDGEGVDPQKPVKVKINEPLVQEDTEDKQVSLQKLVDQQNEINQNALGKSAEDEQKEEDERTSLKAEVDELKKSIKEILTTMAPKVMSTAQRTPQLDEESSPKRARHDEIPQSEEDKALDEWLRD